MRLQICGRRYRKLVKGMCAGELVHLKRLQRGMRQKDLVERRAQGGNAHPYGTIPTESVNGIADIVEPRCKVSERKTVDGMDNHIENGR
jgi:hypothetical protein